MTVNIKQAVRLFAYAHNLTDLTKEKLEILIEEFAIQAERNAYEAVSKETRALIANKVTYKDRDFALTDIALFAEARANSRAVKDYFKGTENE